MARRGTYRNVDYPVGEQCMITLDNPAPGFADELRFVRHRKPGPTIRNADELIAALHEWIMEEPRESVWCVTLDVRGKLLGAVTLSVGGFYASSVDPKVVAGVVITSKAHRFILLHNHPSGDPSPSNEDLNAIRQAKEIGQVLGVPLVDFIILAAEQGQAWSAAQNGKL
jgi:DNA repair protein RadC